MDTQQIAAERISKFVGMLQHHPSIVRLEFQGIRKLLKHAPDACIPIVKHMPSMIAHGGEAWECTKVVAHALVQEIPELHRRMREEWRDALLFQILTDNADDAMRDVARELDLASAAPDHGSLGVARAMTPNSPRPLFVIGAGFSYDSMPLTQELEALVTGLLAGEGIPNPTQLLADHWEAAWQHISDDPKTFKDRFIGFSQARQPATQHRVLSEALRAKTVVGVVSFNWDNHIECSGLGYDVVNSPNQAVEGPGLWKMHGDVNAPDADWVWPQDNGRPLKNVCDHVIEQAHKGHISHVVVVGYGEREQNIGNALLSPLQAACPNWIRVRPTGQAGPQGHIAKSARQFLGELDAFQRAVSLGLV